MSIPEFKIIQIKLIQDNHVYFQDGSLTHDRLCQSSARMQEIKINQVASWEFDTLSNAGSRRPGRRFRGLPGRPTWFSFDRVANSKSRFLPPCQTILILFAMYPLDLATGWGRREAPQVFFKLDLATGWGRREAPRFFKFNLKKSWLFGAFCCGYARLE